MNILLTAKDSFVSRSIYPLLLKEGYNVDTFTHKELDLTKINEVRKILDNKYYDIIINPAIAGQGRLLKEDSYEDFYNNLLMIENIVYLKDKYGKLITFSSGAGNNRQKDIENLKEGEFKEPPINRYSLAKYLCNRRVFGLSNVINLRIFNVFGPLERKDRFIATSIRNYINKKDIEIWGDAWFDFFGVNDAFIVINYLIQNPPKDYFELNLVYNQKYKLSKIAGIINHLNSYQVDIKIIPGINKNYYGSGFKLVEMSLSLLGLEKEIQEAYQETLKNANN